MISPTALDLTFLPSPARPFEGVLFLYSPGGPDRTPVSSSVAAAGLGSWLLRLEPRTVLLRLADGVTASVAGLAMRLPDALETLAAIRPTRDPAAKASVRSVPASIRGWAQAAKLALELAGREEAVPAVKTDERRAPRAVWSVSLRRPGDRGRRDAIADSLPPSAAAAVVDATARPPRAWAPRPLVGAFLDAVADSLVRAGVPPASRPRADGSKRPRAWELRLLRAWTERDNALHPETHGESGLVASLASWSAPLLEADARGVRVALRLETPAGGEGRWRLAYLLQSTSDPTALVEAQAIWSGAVVPGAGEGAETELLRGLAEAARVFRPIERSLREASPQGVDLSADEAWTFLARSAPVLAETGFGLIVPPDLEASARLRLRARVRLEGLTNYRWELALGEEALSEEELEALSGPRTPLMRWRGRWISIDPAELDEARRRLARGGGTLSSGAALAALATGEVEVDGETVELVATGDLAALSRWLRSGAAGEEVSDPAGFAGSLRPYQRRGLGWLDAMERFGLGGCLADDMGLGKTIQVIALSLLRPKRTLLVCPTSVVGNWERELARFAPGIPVTRHHGMNRARSAEELTRRGGTITVTTYAIARRDETWLGSIPWERIVLDEAQGIKNPATRQSRAVRELSRSANATRIALTGTPLENRLTDLWSILDFCNPGLLGSVESFRRRFARPIERWQDDAVAASLKARIRPFVLRRLKSDPAVAISIPEKNEMRVVCALTREQAELYQAEVARALTEIREKRGIERRGRILALLTALKQICNHPSQFKKEVGGPLAGRSGKLARLVEMLEETVASGERALVFTQFRQMGDRLVELLEKTFGEPVPFLHGGVAAAERDEMVRRFQGDFAAGAFPEEAEANRPRVFVLSLRAGGLGLNLTAATQVFHFDRWWNPAVEDQATDRAHRIGQERPVSVYKLVTAGTLEERIDKLLEAKRGLSEKVLGSGERWLTELSDDELAELVSLGDEGEVELESEEPADVAVETAEGVRT